MAASLMPSSISLPKSTSKMAFEPLAFAEAMHSEIGLPERLGVLIVATGLYEENGVEPENGGPARTRTGDLYRVKVAL